MAKIEFASRIKQVSSCNTGTLEVGQMVVGVTNGYRRRLLNSGILPQKTEFRFNEIKFITKTRKVIVISNLFSVSGMGDNTTYVGLRSRDGYDSDVVVVTISDGVLEVVDLSEALRSPSPAVAEWASAIAHITEHSERSSFARRVKGLKDRLDESLRRLKAL